MTDRLPQITPKECAKALEKLGFILRKQTGSHMIFRNPETQRIVCIPYHAKDIHRGLLFTILKQANVNQDEFRKAL